MTNTKQILGRFHGALVERCDRQLHKLIFFRDPGVKEMQNDATAARQLEFEKCFLT